MGHEGEDKGDGQQKGGKCKVTVDGQDIAEVEKMKYLGVTLSASGSCDEEIEQRN